jgi:plasmid stabilization system protein ParE
VNYRVRLSEKAERDIEGVLRWFVTNDAERAAATWLAGLLAKIDTLRNMPNRCAVASESAELDVELRELLFGNRNNKYRILFAVEGSDVHVLHIRRGTRDFVSWADLR